MSDQAAASPLPPVQPYLIRAWHAWCCDHGFTPYIVVKVDESVRVPTEHVRDGEIVLNISASATGGLVLGNEDVRFQARFGGRVRDMCVPMGRVAAIYAKENGQGMGFAVTACEAAQAASPSPAGGSGLNIVRPSGAAPTPPADPPPPPAGGSGLRVVK